MGRNGLFIGEVAARSGVSRKALRLYEAAGILPTPSRSAARYRLYGQETLALLGFVAQARRLGFTLKEIKELLGLRVSRRTSCAQVRSHAENKMADIEKRISSLRQMKRALTRLAHDCETQSGGDCPLLKHLEGEFRR